MKRIVGVVLLIAGIAGAIFGIISILKYKVHWETLFPRSSPADPKKNNRRCSL
ncbi:MAG TPA: hypothetical protein PLW34_11905 [Termitinemataceae bacterium]|nr:hypothetical protein [Termitinemataceae bacterium]